MKMKFVFSLLVVMLCFACSNADKQTGDSTGPIPINTIQKPRTVSDVEPGLFEADSVQVIYYDDPNGDSLRYTRFFTYTESGDTAIIHPFLKEMDQVFMQQNAVRNCRSEGKLYLLDGDEILKTLYFSTRKDSCSYLYFIKDGNFIYLPLTDKAKSWLNKQRQYASKPAGSTGN